MASELTIKQENFCQAYIRLGDKSAAYREAYSCNNMKPETVNKNAFDLFNDNKITTRIEFLQNDIIERNKITIDELVTSLAGMVRFDIADLYDEHGGLKNIHSMPLRARQMITQLDVDEIFSYSDGDKINIGQTKKIRTINKLDAIEKLMKHLGGYEKDNRQKAPVIKTKIQWGNREIEI